MTGGEAEAIGISSVAERMEIDWTVRPLAETPVRAFVIFGVAIAAGLVGWIAMGRPLLGLLGVALILGSTAEYWAGTRYRLSEESASSRVGASLTVIDWANVQRIVVSDREIKLSPLATPTKTDAFRGVTLCPTAANRAAVLDCVRERCPNIAVGGDSA